MNPYNTEITEEFQKEWDQRTLIYKPLQSVYILENEDGYVKFGISKRPEDAISSVGYNNLSKIINSYQSEGYSNAREILRDICNHFNKHKIKGQWFNINYNNGLKYLTTTCNKKGNTIKQIINDKPSEFEIATFNYFKDIEKFGKEIAK